MTMIPDLAISAQRFDITILNEEGGILGKFPNARHMQFAPQAGMLSFEDENRIPTMFYSPTASILIQEIPAVEEEELCVEPPSTIIVEAA